MIVGLIRPCSKGVRTMEKTPYIKEGRLYNVSIAEYFNVRLNDDENPSICPTVVMDGMPIKIAKKLLHESLKVRGRPAMKKMDTQTLRKTYAGKISWLALFSKEGAERHRVHYTMNRDEKIAEIKRLQAIVDAEKDDFDADVEKIEMENDIKIEDVDEDEPEDFTETEPTE